MPWWGKRYFTDDVALRTLVVSQDSLALDAGSIVFYACLMPFLSKQYDYEQFTCRLNENQRFKYSSWKKIKDTFDTWKLDWNYLYITDAKKVYKQNNPNSFDVHKSRELLEREIEFCNPNLVILLGSPPLRLVDGTRKYSDCVLGNNVFHQNGRTFVVAPFPAGQSPSQATFVPGMAYATRAIHSSIAVLTGRR